MCRKSTLFIVIFIALQVVLAGNAFAAENGYTWWNGGGAADHRFTTGANWWQGVAPDINNTPRTSLMLHSLSLFRYTVRSIRQQV